MLNQGPNVLKIDHLKHNNQMSDGSDKRHFFTIKSPNNKGQNTATIP